MFTLHPFLRASISIAAICGLMMLCLQAFFFFTISTHNLPNPTETQNSIILIATNPDQGGLERYVLAQHKELIAQNAHSILLCPRNSFLEKKCIELQLPCISFNSTCISFNRFVWMPGLKMALNKDFKLYKSSIRAIISHCRRAALVAHTPAKQINVPLILTRHASGPLPKYLRQAVDCIITVGPQTTHALNVLNKHDGITCPVVTLPPCFDLTRIASYTPSQTSREQFFKEQFHINLTQAPLLTLIANLFPHKNQALLFKALHTLIFERHITLQAVLAGTGPQLREYQKMIDSMQLTEYIHLIGSTELIPALLQYADINLLTSSSEPFGIVLLEGGLLHKPTLLPSTGCEAANWLIIDRETGSLFEQNNATDLADKIEYMLTHPDYAQTCGDNLHDKVVREFLPAQTVHTILDLIAQLLEQKRSLHA